MYCTFDDLFNKRESTGIKLKGVLNDRKCTKLKLSQETGISRPTIDKLINGSITNKTSFEKHMKKIFQYLNVSLDAFMTKDQQNENQIGNLQRLTGLTTKKLSIISNISHNRLLDINQGNDASLEDIIKLAYSLNTSAHIIKNNYFFDPQFFNKGNVESQNFDKKYQFWGYIGIKLNEHTEIKYYPITFNTMEYISNNFYYDQIVIPCLNNIVLLLNMKNIQKLVFISNDNTAMKEKEVFDKLINETYPLVIYELLNANSYKELKDKSLIDFDFDSFEKMNKRVLIDISSLYYKNGEYESKKILFSKCEMLCKEIVSKYKFLNDETIKYLEVINIDDIKEIINFDYLSLVEMPLLKLEKNILDFIK